MLTFDLFLCCSILMSLQVFFERSPSHSVISVIESNHGLPTSTRCFSAPPVPEYESSTCAL